MLRLCALVEIERSSYYAWKAGAPARIDRAAADAELAERIRVIHEADNTGGAPRVTAELNDGVPAGERVNHKRVARVMRAAGIAGYVKKRRVRTTIPEPSDWLIPDLLKRGTSPRMRRGDAMSATSPYLPLADGTNLYLATVIDCYSRRLAGWAVADQMRTSLVEDALTAAAATRGGSGGLAGAVFHSDHGSVYTSKDYAKLYAHPRRDPVDGCRGYVGRQRARGVVQRHPPTRGPPRRRLLAQRAHLPPAALQVADPLQHQTAPLLVPIPVPVHLRGPLGRYAFNRCVINPRVQETGGRPQ